MIERWDASPEKAQELRIEQWGTPEEVAVMAAPIRWASNRRNVQLFLPSKDLSLCIKKYTQVKAAQSRPSVVLRSLYKHLHITDNKVYGFKAIQLLYRKTAYQELSKHKRV